jgi:hypothetical protein
MNNLPYYYLEPEDCENLTKIRLGYKGDGGYCIPREILKDITTVVTFGVNNEDSFERDLNKELGHKTDFYLCDPFCEYTQREGNEEFKFLSVGLDGVTSEEKKMTSWPDFREKILGPRENIFLKVDIENAEWESFKNLKSEDFNGVEMIVIEFHSILSSFDRYQKQIQVLKQFQENFYLYHIHSNNHGYLFTHDSLGNLPDTVECTYIKKSWAAANGYTFIKRTNGYPEKIDFPCHETKYDPVICWWNVIKNLQ